MHKGLMDGLLSEPGQVGDPDNFTMAEIGAAEAETSKAVKAVLLISGPTNGNMPSSRTNMPTIICWVATDTLIPSTRPSAYLVITR